MSSKRRRKAKRRNAREKGAASRLEASPHTEVDNSARALPPADSARPVDLFVLLAPNQPGPGAEFAYDYCADDQGWFVVPRAGEPFELPLTGELESGWGLLAEQNPACAPVCERIRALRAAGRTHVTATQTCVFWEALLPDGSTACLEPASDDHPASVDCPDLAATSPISFWASELGFERFDGEVALPAYPWMTGQSQLPAALARRAGERWTDAYRVRFYDNAGAAHESIPPEVCAPRQR